MSHRSFTMLVALGTLGAALQGCHGGDGPQTEPLPDCENRGDQYFAGIAKTSDDGAMTVQIASAAPAPPANSYTNHWELLITSGAAQAPTTDAAAAEPTTDAAAAEPITGALVIAAPYMIDHGHGAPNVIASETGGGAYLIDPLSLKMNGLWDVTMKVTPPSGVESRVVFSFCVQPL